MTIVDIDGHDIILGTEERDNLIASSARCPFLKWAPLIPHADKFYAYCDIRHGALKKAGIDKSYLYHYCCEPNTNLAFMECDIWQESYTED